MPNSRANHWVASMREVEARGAENDDGSATAEAGCAAAEAPLEELSPSSEGLGTTPSVATKEPLTSEECSERP